MAVKTTTTKVLRHHLSLRNGGTRYVDIDNPIDNTSTISSNIFAVNMELSSNSNGILVGNDFFDGDSDAVVTQITSAEIIETQKTVTTTDIAIQ